MSELTVTLSYPDHEEALEMYAWLTGHDREELVHTAPGFHFHGAVVRERATTLKVANELFRAKAVTLK